MNHGNNKSATLKLSIDGPFAHPSSCFPTTSTKKLRTEFCKKLDLYVGDTPVGTRVLALQKLRTSRGERMVYMDVVTGTLYRPEDGRCYTSDYLFIRDIRRDAAAVKTLINNRGVSYNDYQF